MDRRRLFPRLMTQFTELFNSRGHFLHPCDFIALNTFECSQSEWQKQIKTEKSISYAIKLGEKFVFPEPPKFIPSRRG